MKVDIYRIGPGIVLLSSAKEMWVDSITYFVLAALRQTAPPTRTENLAHESKYAILKSKTVPPATGPYAGNKTSTDGA